MSSRFNAGRRVFNKLAIFNDDFQPFYCWILVNQQWLMVDSKHRYWWLINLEACLQSTIEVTCLPIETGELNFQGIVAQRVMLHYLGQ